MASGNLDRKWTESERLAALARYSILDTPREQAFDNIVQMLVQILGVPIAAVNLIAEGRQWFKSEIGLGVREMALENSFCASAILQPGGLVVPDTTRDPRFACNPLVTGEPGLRFYAGELLETPEGYPLGTLCVLDTRPRPEGLSAAQRFVLKTLAQQIMSQLELRRTLKAQDDLLAEHQRVEAELRSERDHSRRLLEGMEEGFKILDRDFRVLQINSGGLRIDGRPASDIIGRCCWDLWPGLENLPLAQAYRRAQRDGVPVNLEQHYAYPGGRSAWFDVRILPADEHLVVFYRDITEKKNAEEALRASEQRLAATFNQASVGISELDLEGRFIRMNEAFCRMVGRPQERLLGLSFCDITHPSYIADSLLKVEKLMETGEPFTIEKRYLRADGSSFWAASNVARIMDDQGSPKGFIAVTIDISERKRFEEDLQRLAAELSEANGRQSAFLATLAHELRNPLAPIRSGLEVLRLEGNKPAVVAKMQEMMDRQVTHMVHLIDDLLDVARITRGKLELKKERVELRTVMASAVETSLPLIEAARHELNIHLPEGSLPLHADPTRVAQVVSNLLNNAAKYTPPGGRIKVWARRERNEVLISVMDNGVGLSPESLSRVFEMFTQVRSEMDRSQGGLGIGLTLVRQLVDLHGGSVTATSPGVGKGSAFTVRLPLAKDGHPEEQNPSAGNDPDCRDCACPLKLLIVDDNSDAATALSSFLQIKGHHTRIAHDGVQALAIARDFLPAVVVLDIGMPGMDGYEVAQMLRRMEGMQHALLIALTGWGTEEDRARAKAAGFDHHLTKPAPLPSIEKLLSNVTRSREPAPGRLEIASTSEAAPGHG